MVKKRKSGPEKRKSGPKKKVPELLDEEVEVERHLGHLNVVRTEMIKQLDKDDAKDRLHYLIDREMAPLSLRMHFLNIEKHKWGCTFQEAEMRLASIGFIFSPEDGILDHHYLKKKCSSLPIPMNPIKEAVVYGTHPLNLIEDYPAAGGNVWYFFTRSRPNGTSEGGHWIFGKEINILYQGNKVGVKQLLQYCEGCRKTECKINEYRLEPPLDDNLKEGPWFICKLYKDESCEDVES